MSKSMTLLPWQVAEQAVNASNTCSARIFSGGEHECGILLENEDEFEFNKRDAAILFDRWEEDDVWFRPNFTHLYRIAVAGDDKLRKSLFDTKCAMVYTYGAGGIQTIPGIRVYKRVMISEIIGVDAYSKIINEED